MFLKGWPGMGGHNLYYHTTNSGLVWYAMDSTTKNNLNDASIYYKYKDKIYSINNDTSVFVTTDNGNSWNMAFSHKDIFGEYDYLDAFAIDSSGYFYAFGQSAARFFRASRLRQRRR